MRIVMRDERVFQGTPIQIVRAMQDIAFGVDQLSLAQYIDWVVDNARRFEEVQLQIEGPGDDERAESLVREMVRTGLARWA